MPVKTDLGGASTPTQALTARELDSLMADAEIAQIVRSFKYRLLPSKAQHAALRAILDSQRELYNAALQERVDCYAKTGKSRTYVDQCKAVTECRSSIDAMSSIPANIQRATLKRLDEAYRGFFRRVKSGGKVGFPRFRGKDRFNGFGFAEFSGIRFDGKRLRFKGLPSGLRVHLHRLMPEGKILGCTFKRDTKGWTVSFQVRIAIEHLPPTRNKIGIDVGLSSFATFDDGSAITAPKIARRNEREMRRRQRALARCKRGSNNRKKVRLAVAKLHAKIANTRDTFLHQVSAKLVRENDMIAIENLNVKGLASGMLARSVNDASWAKFRFMLTYKAEGAGRKVIAVDPRNTTQSCSGCGVIVPKTLAQRWHSCSECGLSLDRDHNAALNILHKAVVGLGIHNQAVTHDGCRNLILEGISN